VIVISILQIKAFKRTIYYSLPFKVERAVAVSFYSYLLARVLAGASLPIFWYPLI
jgi:hypothetical protein